jgi:hypothetical protein
MGHYEKDQIDYLLKTLNIDRSRLAALLNMEEKSILEMEKFDRVVYCDNGLKRLCQVVEMIEKEERSGRSALYILENIGIPLTHGKHDEFGNYIENSILLIDYVTAFPDDVGWVANVFFAMGDYHRNKLHDRLYGMVQKELK